MSRLLGDAWVQAGGFPPGTFGPVPRAPGYPAEVIERAARLREARDEKDSS